MNRDDNLLWDFNVKSNKTWMESTTPSDNIELDIIGGRARDYKEYIVRMSNGYYRIDLMPLVNNEDGNESIDEDDLLLDLEKLISLGYYGHAITYCVAYTSARYYGFGIMDDAPMIIIREADMMPLEIMRVINVKLP